ncbi:MAG: putative rane protein [Acidobacteriota bacterium]|jgi:putative membrane protein|nr:putative rane protein [Acidobacteriota bacterium]
MKQKFAILMLAAALAACNSQTENAGQPATDTTASTATSDTMMTSTMSDTAATTTGSTGGTISNMSPEDKEFVSKAGMGGMAEVQMGTLASQKGTSADVKAFGQRMVADHSKANAELQQLATTKGLALPTELGGEHKDAFDHLNGLSGAAFDKAYMKHMVEDHEKDVAEFEKASQNAGDADLKGWAGKTLPTLQDHLKQAKAVNGKLK